MKVGILTFPNSISYGATLQMFALYHTVNKLGHEAEIINYHNAYMKDEKHVNNSNLSPFKRKLKKAVKKGLHLRIYKEFVNFEKGKMKLYPTKPFTEKARLAEVGKRYNAVICGSDQVWNPDITGGDLSYFLDFCDANTKRVAYAPSFGHSEFSDDFQNAICGDLKKFHALSAREAPGQTLVSKLTGKDVPLVCDPTFLLSADDWTSLEKAHPAAKGEYILYYTVRSSESLWKQCKAFAKEKGLKIVVVGGNLLKQWKEKDGQIQYAVDIGPEQWLYLLHHARYVVTNSFHGTAFSINYHKDFYVEFSSLTNSRLEQITQALGLTDQIVVSVHDYVTYEKIMNLLKDDHIL
jgi:hypothetical protein